jgi:hypothetical protein
MPLTNPATIGDFISAAALPNSNRNSNVWGTMLLATISKANAPGIGVRASAREDLQI